MIRWPFTNIHELNLNWIIMIMKELVEKVTDYGTKVIGVSTTTGAAGSDAEVSISGDLDTGLSFDFTIPRGAQGAKGDPGSVTNISSVDIALGSSSITIPAGGFQQVVHTFTSEEQSSIGNTDLIIGIKGIILSQSSSIVCSGISFRTVLGESTMEVRLINIGSSEVTVDLSASLVTVSKYTN